MVNFSPLDKKNAKKQAKKKKKTISPLKKEFRAEKYGAGSVIA